MALQKIRLGTNEDGTPLYHYIADGPVVFTGQATGVVTLADGRVVDVTEPFVEVADQAEADELSDAIGAKFVEDGHPAFVADPEVDSFGFAHTASDGTVSMNAKASDEAVAEAARQLGVDADTIVKVEA